MPTKLIVLALAALTLAACETASHDDIGVRRGASPTRGDLTQHMVVRGPVVADAAVTPRAAHTARSPAVTRVASAATRPATAHHAATPAVKVVANPLRAATPAPATASTTTETAAATPAAPVSPEALLNSQTPATPTEPVQPASATQATAPEPAPVTTSTISGYPQGDTQTLPVSEQAPQQQVAPISLGLGDLTPDKISALFGGMPFLLIASIAAALVASFGLALRTSPRKQEEIEEPRIDHEDYRESYAA